MHLHLTRAILILLVQYDLSQEIVDHPKLPQGDIM